MDRAASTAKSLEARNDLAPTWDERRDETGAAYVVLARPAT